MGRILYLHGFASGPGSRKATHLANQFSQIGAEMLIPDLNEGDFRGLTVTRQLRLVERLARQGPFELLIGSSLGGYTAALYASLRPQNVTGLCLLAPAFHFAKRLEDRLGPEQMATWRESGVIEMPHYGTGRPEPIGYQLYEDALWHEPAPAVKHPTLIFHGRRDDDVPAQLSVDYSWGKPNVRLELLDSDHGLTDALDTIWTDMANFYRQLPRNPETLRTRGA